MHADDKASHARIYRSIGLFVTYFGNYTPTQSKSDNLTQKNNPAKPIGPAGYKGEEAKDKISYATNYVILMPA